LGFGLAAVHFGSWPAGNEGGGFDTIRQWNALDTSTQSLATDSN